MGDPSSLRFVPAPGSTIPINWARVPEATKKALLKLYGYDWENRTTKPLPETVADLAKMFDETKFFGYFRPEVLTILMDISEFGLQAAATPTSLQAGPRFYMTYIGEVWFFLFAPGERDCIVGHSGRITREIEEDDDDDDDDYETKRAANETAIAKEFDVKLEREVSRGMACLVGHTNKLGGWEASTAKSDLEFSQYATAIMGLPRSHPMYRDLMQNVFRSFSR
ncbi:hypothetical protein F5887DRAFT_947668 [Amanita rubescens]|nr:hypothetical protein F5887DRAFT_947668 [Amanita rubescens]